MKLFLLHEINKRKTSLFGMLSSTLTFHVKTKAWLSVRDHVAGAGYPQLTKELIDIKLQYYRRKIFDA